MRRFILTIGLFFGLTAPTMAGNETQVFPVQLAQAPIHECDRLAASPNDPNKVGDGVNWKDLNTGKARIACKSAIQDYPDDIRFQYQYWRMIEKDVHQKLKGSVFEKAHEKTAKRILRVAEKGYTYAQFILARMYVRGNVLSEDTSEAYFWASLAAKQVNKHKFTSRRDKYSAWLSQESVTAVDKRVAEWQPKSAEPVNVADTKDNQIAKKAGEDIQKGDILKQLKEEKKRREELERRLAEDTSPRFPSDPVPVTFPKGAPRPDDIAVIIGNADYGKQGGSIPDVTPAYADAAGVKRYVTEALGVKEGNVIFLKDATQAQFISVFGSKENHKGKLFNWIMPGESRVFVFYSGHGAPGGADGGAYLVPSDADAATIELNGYSLDTLYRNLGKLPAKSITVVLEACFSGAAEGGAVISNASPVYLKAKVPPIPPKVTVIAAGAPNQMASWEQDKSHGLFTKYFLKGMSGEADAGPYGNGDGKVSWNELERYFKRTLTYYARRYYGRDQTAQIVVGKGG